MRTEKKHQLKQLRKWRIRNKLSGTKDRPRMSVCFTNENIHVQFIDDDAGVTLAAASTTGKAVPDRDKLAANVAGAQVIGKLAAEAALAKASSPLFLIAVAPVIIALRAKARTASRYWCWANCDPGRGRAQSGFEILTNGDRKLWQTSPKPNPKIECRAAGAAS